MLLNRELFRDIDIAFARFVMRLAPGDAPGVALAALLTSQAIGEGHVCLELHQWAGRLIRGPHDAEGVTCPPLDEWMDQLRSSPLVSRRESERPLVWDDAGRVYLQRLYQDEQQLARSLRQRALADSMDLSAVQALPVRSLLDRYFRRSNGDSDMDWQKVAALVAILKRLCIISGAPGTGKTTTVAKILGVLLELAGPSTLRIHLCTPTGKAAARLGMALAEAARSLACPDRVAEELAALEPCTIHRLLGYQPSRRRFLHTERNPLPADVVVVDEASMVDLVLMSRLVRAIPSDARLIILGDKDQLASVEAGAVFGDLCRGAAGGSYSPALREAIVALTGAAMKPSVPVPPVSTLRDCLVELHENYRFDPSEGIGALARAINAGDGDRIKHVFRAPHRQNVRWWQWRTRTEYYKVLAASALKGYEAYLASRSAEEALENFSRFMILSVTIAGPFGVDRINGFVAQQLQKARLIGRSRPWFAGRPVMITRNDYQIGLYNGDTGLVWPDAEGRLRVWFEGEGGRLRDISPQRIPPHQTVFAMTVHKSQGSEFNRILLVLPDQDTPLLTRELVYTGCTRARRQVTLLSRDERIAQAVTRTIQRRSGLYDALRPRPDLAPRP
jgi:exodeoxyribonuclease V alpha subunit